MKLKNATKVGYIEVFSGGVFDMTYPNSKTRRGRVVDGGSLTPTLATGCDIGYVESDDRIRKLTPKECFRLQAWDDEYFERAAFVNFDSQLYKQAGNGVTVSVIYEIAKRMT